MTPGNIITALRTDVGRRRNNNEDSIAADAELGLLIVADGMGGYKAGEVASALAVQTTLEMLRRESPQLTQGDPRPPSALSAAALLLRQALESANERIHKHAKSDRSCAGMGTTAVACLLCEDRMAIAWVGDSRLYRWRAGRLQQLTRDHSMLEELIASRRYSREEAQRWAAPHVVTRALGAKQSVEVDLLDEDLAAGDIVLLCSDGLSDMLDEAAISSTITEFADRLDDTAQALIDRANANGGRDNISVVLAQMPAAAALPQPWIERVIARIKA